MLEPTLIYNVNIIHTDDVIVRFNGEQNVENLFVYKNNKHIDHITYVPVLSFDETIISKEFKQRHIVTIPAGFLFYSFRYQIAYGHMVEQCLPKLYDYINLQKRKSDLKLLIPQIYYNRFISNFMEVMGIDKTLIIPLKKDAQYALNEFYYKNYQCCDTGSSKINAFNMFRNKLNIIPNICGIRNVYLQRNTLPIEDTGCYNIGKSRQILNESELIYRLKQLNFEILSLGNDDIVDKSYKLSNVNILITQTGGTMYNLFFANTPRHIIFLSNKSPVYVEYVDKMLPLLNNYTHHMCTLLLNESLVVHADKTNNTNDPFNVNCDDIVRIITDILR